MVVRAVRIGRIGLICAFGTTAATLFIPALRELQFLNLRLICHIPFRGTYVEGQPPGCCVFVVPNVRLTKLNEVETKAAAARSADDFILARSQLGEPPTFPDATRWQGNPLLQWAALDGAHMCRRYGLHPATKPAEGCPPRMVTRDRHVLDTILAAQSMFPENGALWVAQAHVLFENGDEVAAVQALEHTFQKGVWKHQFPEAFPPIRRVLEEAGLSKLDASLGASGLISWGPISPVDASVREHLMLLMARSIAAGNNVEFGRLVSLFNQYRIVARQQGRVGREFSLLDCRELAEVLRVALGRPALDLNTPFAEQERIATQWWDEYLDAHVTPALAIEFRNESTVPIRRLGCRYDRCARSGSGLVLAMTSTRYAMLTLVLMAVILAALVSEAPFRWFTAPHKESRISPGFALATALAFAVMTCVIFGTIDSFLHPVGLRAITTPPLLTSSQENLVCSAVLAIGFLILRGVCWRVPSVFRAGVIVLFCFYLSSLTMASQWREMAAEQYAFAYE